MATKDFDRRLRQVRVRCGINGLLEHVAWAVLAAAVPAAVAVLVWRLFAIDLISTRWILVLAAVLVSASLAWWAWRIPSRMKAALLADDRLCLAERMSTTLAMAASSDAFALAARDEANQVVHSVVVAKAFPVRLSRGWLYAAGAWVMVCLLAWLVPQEDLLGLHKKRQQQQAQAQRAELAKKDIQNVTDAVKMAVERLNVPDANKDLAGLTSTFKAGKPEDIKRQAISQLSSLSDKVKDMQSSVKIQSMQQLQQMLQQLRPTGQGAVQQIEMSMAKGEFGKAAAMLKQLQQDMLAGNLSDQQKQELAKQLQDLSQQLQKLAQQQKGLEQQLQEMGLDKKLAKMDAQQLKEALQKQGVTGDKIDDLMQKAAAGKEAANRANALSMAMGGSSSGASAEDLAAAAGQLDEMEGIQQQIRLSQGTLAEIERAIAQLGEGMGYGDGYGEFREGDPRGRRGGTGGPGQGFGARDSDTEGAFGTKKAQVKAQVRQGPIVASWYFKGEQAKGEAQRPFQEVVSASRDSAAEAIQDNQIPAKYQEAVKKYFGDLGAVDANE
jgi:regulator of replication initiation timing